MIDTKELARIAEAALPLWDEEWDESTPVELAAVEAFSDTFDPPTVSALLAERRVLVEALKNMCNALAAARDPDAQFFAAKIDATHEAAVLLIEKLEGQP